MPPATDRDYVTIQELSVRTGASLATLHRLKRAGKISYYQPGGKGHLLRFPIDAIEQAIQQANTAPQVATPQKLSGPRPAWMAAEPSTNE
jgi:excisionase family DNA binding protein